MGKMDTTMERIHSLACEATSHFLIPEYKITLKYSHESDYTVSFTLNVSSPELTGLVFPWIKSSFQIKTYRKDFLIERALRGAYEDMKKEIETLKK